MKILTDWLAVKIKGMDKCAVQMPNYILDYVMGEMALVETELALAKDQRCLANNKWKETDKKLDAIMLQLRWLIDEKRRGTHVEVR